MVTQIFIKECSGLAGDWDTSYNKGEHSENIHRRGVDHTSKK